MTKVLANRHDLSTLTNLKQSIEFSSGIYQLALQLDQGHELACVSSNQTRRTLKALKGLAGRVEELWKAYDHLNTMLGQEVEVEVDGCN